MDAILNESWIKKTKQNNNNTPPACSPSFGL